MTRKITRTTSLQKYARRLHLPRNVILQVWVYIFTAMCNMKHLEHRSFGGVSVCVFGEDFQDSFSVAIETLWARGCLCRNNTARADTCFKETYSILHTYTYKLYYICNIWGIRILSYNMLYKIYCQFNILKQRAGNIINGNF